jgi:hypothetical protein
MNRSRMRWARHVAGMGRKINICKILVEKLKESDHLEDLGVDGKIILEWILERGGKLWPEFIWLRIRTSDGLLLTRK